MKRMICLLTALLVLAFFAGCKEETAPIVTRISVSPTCGVIPLRIEVYGAASGGDESGDPTGGVNNLEYTWDFGDGSSSTSISYHEYTVTPDSFYTITLTVTDPDGKVAKGHAFVWAFEDSLRVEASMSPDTGITTATPVTFDYVAETCAIDPDLDDDYVKLSPIWRIEDPAFPDGEAVYYGRSPVHTFSAPGTYDAHLNIYFAEWSVYRNVHVQVTVDP